MAWDVNAWFPPGLSWKWPCFSFPQALPVGSVAEGISLAIWLLLKGNKSQITPLQQLEMCLPSDGWEDTLTYRSSAVMSPCWSGAAVGDQWYLVLVHVLVYCILSTVYVSQKIRVLQRGVHAGRADDGSIWALISKWYMRKKFNDCYITSFL